ncbi:MAG: CocE/NonD family hydrolase [Alphaproteobacteria bacterium]
MLTRDGVRLDADIYRPQENRPDETFPVLLMRQPYGRRIASTVVFAHPTWFAAHGYIVVIQDIRGRGTSDGTYALFANDAEDGADAVRWAATLPGANGRVGMYGFSYQGVSQLLAASALLSETGSARPLHAMAPAMIGYGIHDDWVYEGGAFYLAPNIGWGIQMAAEEARLAGDEKAFIALRQGLSAFPLGGAEPCKPDLLMEHPAYGHYVDWVTRPAPGDYWDRISPAGKLEGLDVPVLHVGGWYDLMLPGTLAAYRDLSANAAAPQSLMIGPWTHMNWTGWQPAGHSGTAAETHIDHALIAWFDRWLKELPNDSDPEAFVRLFEVGGDCWREFDEFPSPKPTPLYLSGTGRAALVPGSGQLVENSSEESRDDSIVLDPWRPTPTTGGHADDPGGRVDRAETDARSDVATFTSAPLERDIRLAGSPRIVIHCQSDRASFDLSLVLSEVLPDGRVINLTEGFQRVAVGVVTAPIEVELRPVVARLSRGHAVRLSIALASYPAHALNVGDGTADRDARLMDMPITTVTITHGGVAGSCVLLPVTDD